ncbi:hypothetical protein [Rhizobium leguminosarum]|uniref:hypothetical protein n=1 Tax=Rhizobium leguminosarum TaxID=384 RepID=UPI001AEC4C4B|nr:hypothetical protein [Rhizobium leguminosarum]
MAKLGNRLAGRRAQRLQTSNKRTDEYLHIVDVALNPYLFECGKLSSSEEFPGIRVVCQKGSSSFSDASGTAENSDANAIHGQLLKPQAIDAANTHCVEHSGSLMTSLPLDRDICGFAHTW